MTRILSDGCQVFRSMGIQLDCVVIVCGILEKLLQALGSGEDISKIGLSRALRLIRIVRLTRIVSRTRRFRELHKLIRMMATCLKALLWSFVFCFVCMTVWAMLIVEVINPLVQE
ncbi:Sodium channel protein type 11 subunit alpha, partial [Durusdinium trenchii]